MDIRRASGWVLVALGAAGCLAIGIAIVALLLRPGPFLPRLVQSLVYALGALIPYAFAAVGWRIVRPKEEPPRAPRRVTPMPPVTDAELVDLREPISACPDCGFLGIRMPTIGDGLWPGGGETGDRMVCPRCDWQGLPARFETRADYGAWLRERHSPNAAQA